VHILDLDYHKIKHSMVIKNVPESIITDNTEDFNDVLDIDPIFTPEQSKFIQMKSNKFPLPQPIVKKDSSKFKNS
jgi:hypothetical protein